MKLLDIVWKEISLIKAQKIALALIFIYPFLVVGLLGSAFTGIDVSKAAQAKVGFVNNLDFNSEIINNFSQSKDLSIFEYDDVNSLRLDLANKKVIAGVVLSGASQYRQLRADFLYDNSNLLSSRFFMEIAKAVMQKMTIQLAQKQLGEVWTTITSFGTNLKSEINNVEDFKRQLASAEASLNKLDNDLKQFDFTEIESILSSQKTAVSGYNSKIDSFKQSIAKFKTSFNSARSQYNSFRSKVNEYESRLNILLAGVDSSVSSLDQVRELLLSTQQALPEGQQKQAITDSLAKLDALRAELVSEKQFLDELVILFAEIKNDQSEINRAFTDADSVFAQLDSETQNLESAVSSSNSAVNTMDSKLQVFKESIDEIKNLISEARTSKVEIESKLNASSALLSTFSTQIVEFSNIDSSVLAQPVGFYEVKLFSVDPFGILVSNALVVVLVLTCMLLTSIIVILERTENVALRLELSPTNKAMLLVGKIIGQLVIALIEAGIIFIVAFAKIPLPFPILGITNLGFGLASSVNLFELFLAVVLVSLTFICLGLIIASFAKNQSTAILTSLLLIVPMLFLSGVVLPIEFMEPYMQLISGLLPMTIANNLLIGLIIKGLSLPQLWFESALLAGYCLVILLIVFFKKEH